MVELNHGQGVDTTKIRGMETVEEQGVNQDMITEDKDYISFDANDGWEEF